MIDGYITKCRQSGTCFSECERIFSKSTLSLPQMQLRSGVNRPTIYKNEQRSYLQRSRALSHLFQPSCSPTHRLLPSRPPSLPPALPHSIPPSLPSFCPPSLPPSLLPSLPPALPPSRPTSRPPDLPPALSTSLPPSRLPSLPSSLPPTSPGSPRNIYISYLIIPPKTATLDSPWAAAEAGMGGTLSPRPTMR